ncbi:MAG: bifunctional demethylmenaquinone methyltransferase/2-methoxy-6-polyprenyl-1,4-benzoquinol methylase UbiE [Thermoleophilaceae bacterium]|nr:bifunctional demethylmenaquinone methyltransferase/2-methoxy-6-polyprenyl-1,4-benzoquinol methylase UbiE [Thermoleophilaceae bacterium]
MSDSAAAQKGTLPEEQVEAMFDRIAKRYDLMNSVMTAGLHDEWRRRAVKVAGVKPGDHVLDVATGTGDLAFELARAVAPGGSVTGADFSEEMLSVARQKQGSEATGLDAEIVFEQGNALDLKYDDDTFDAVTVGFGVRNFSDLAAGLTEMARVVRPGGKFVILEISQPQKGALSYFYKAWFDGLVPFIGKFAGEDSAYTYLPNSVKRFAKPEALAAVLHEAGTEQVGWISLAGGIITIHHGVVV